MTDNLQQGKYQGKGLKSYVASMTKFQCLKAYDRRVLIPLDETEHIDQRDSPLDEVEAQEQLALVHRAFSQLAVRCRRMLVLRFLRDLDHERIAQTMGIRTGTSRQWLKRCIDKLRTIVRKAENV
jgi:RNA polymerase sigma factor (sigma-70 family)